MTCSGGPRGPAWSRALPHSVLSTALEACCLKGTESKVCKCDPGLQTQQPTATMVGKGAKGMLVSTGARLQEEGASQTLPQAISCQLLILTRGGLRVSTGPGLALPWLPSARAARGLGRQPLTQQVGQHQAPSPHLGWFYHRPSKGLPRGRGHLSHLGHKRYCRVDTGGLVERPVGHP